MNQIVTIDRSSFGLVPANMGEAMELAKMMAGARLVPKDLQGSPADCLMVIQQAVRWQMDPFAVAQECSVIQGKLMQSGKLVAAVVNTRANLTARLSFAYDGNGDHRTITVSGQLQGESEPRSVTVVLKDAKTNNRVWQTQPDQQLMYHGARVWARRHTPEVMLGVWSPEEFDETPAAPAPRVEARVEHRRPAAPAPNPMLPAPELPPHDADGVIIEPPVPPADDGLGIPGFLQRAPVATDEEGYPTLMEWDTRLAEAAKMGTEHLQKVWKMVPHDFKKTLKAALDKRHKVAAQAADDEKVPL